jgi:molybdopterin synthase sulfur carrier subunit
VEVRLFATLERYLPATANGDTAVLDLPAGARVEQAIAELGIPAALPVVAVVNGYETVPDTPLADGDVVTVFPPLAGGSSPPLTVRCPGARRSARAAPCLATLERRLRRRNPGGRLR